MLLYKYLGREDFFSNLKLRITPPNELNDPRECLPDIRLKDPRGYLNDVIQRNFQSYYFRLLIDQPLLTPQKVLDACLSATSFIEKDFYGNNDTWVKRHFESFMEVTNKNVGILSLSETDRNELMWSHYANSHNGFVIGFDSENNFFKPQKSDPKVCGKVMKVQYTDTAPIVYVDPGKLDLPKELFFTKTTKWSYECEWRMVKLLSSANNIIGGKHSLV